MREMKDSGVEWIGEIPIEWKICKLKNIASIQTGNTPPKNIQSTFYSDESGTPWIKAEDLGKRDSISETKEYLTEDGKKEGRIFPANTVFVCCIASIGKTGFSEQECSCNQQINGIIFNRMQWKYGYYMTLAQESEYIFNASGNVMKIINTEKQGDLRCPLPTKCDQERIVNYLDIKCSKIDEIIKKQQAIIEKLKEYKLSIITEAVTKGLNPDVEMKDSGNTWFGYIPAHWDCVISRFVFEKVSDINHFMPESIDSGYPYLMIGDLKEHISDIDFENCKKISKMDFDCLKQKMKSQKGDVIFARYATIGTVCYVDIDIDFLVSYACVTVRPNKELYGEYLYYYFKSCAFRENVKQFINSNTQENVGIEALCKTKITIPPYKEQKMIVNYLNEKSKNIDISIEKKRNIVEKLQEYKKSLIYEVVTGKKEV